MLTDDYWEVCKDSLRQYSHYRLLEKLHDTHHLTSTAFFAIRAKMLWDECQPRIVLPVPEEHYAFPSERTGKEVAPVTQHTVPIGAVTVPVPTERWGTA